MLEASLDAEGGKPEYEYLAHSIPVYQYQAVGKLSSWYKGRWDVVDHDSLT